MPKKEIKNTKKNSSLDDNIYMKTALAAVAIILILIGGLIGYKIKNSENIKTKETYHSPIFPFIKGVDKKTNNNATAQTKMNTPTNVAGLIVIPSADNKNTISIVTFINCANSFFFFFLFAIYVSPFLFNLTTF